RLLFQHESLLCRHEASSPKVSSAWTRISQTAVLFPGGLQYITITIKPKSSLANHSSSTGHPPLSLTLPAIPSLVFPLDFRPPISLYMSLISPLPGLDSSASERHFSSF